MEAIPKLLTTKGIDHEYLMVSPKFKGGVFKKGEIIDLILSGSYIAGVFHMFVACR